MSKKKLRLPFFIFFLLGSFCFAQDTIYVYEEEVVYDTVFVDKDETEFKIEAQKKEKKPTKSSSKILRTSDPFLFGARLLGGSKSHGFFRSIRDMHNLGYGGGIWIEKSLWMPQFSLILSADYLKWNSNFNFNESQTTTQLSGYYFNAEGSPALFQSFSDKHNELLGSLRGKFSFRNAYFSAGLNLSYYQLKMQFLIPENMRLTKLVDFKNNNWNIGYAGALGYEFPNKFSLFFEYQRNSYQNLEFRNNEFGSIVFEIENVKKIKDQKFFLGVSYRFSK